jgi:hypothetical protein
MVNDEEKCSLCWILLIATNNALRYALSCAASAGLDVNVQGIAMNGLLARC